jgi:hypothetical protein
MIRRTTVRSAMPRLQHDRRYGDDDQIYRIRTMFGRTSVGGVATEEIPSMTMRIARHNERMGLLWAEWQLRRFILVFLS